jgi:Ca2+-binding EF-hand superfamily protein
LFKSGGKNIQFPGYLSVSNNYFRKMWAFTSYRRIKNVIIVMDWIPDLYAIKTVNPTADKRMLPDLTPQQNTQLRRAYDFFRLYRQVSISIDEFKLVLHAMDVKLESEKDLLDRLEELGMVGNRAVPFEEFRLMVQNQAFHKIHFGRYYVALALDEAEGLRGLMHKRLRKALINNANVALGLRTEDILLDWSEGYVPAPEYQEFVSRQSFRFFDSDVYYTERQQSVLLRTLQDNEPEKRQVFFNEVRACRRRTQKDWQNFSVAPVFKLKDEYCLLEFRSMLLATRVLMRAKDMRPFDAFRAFDANRDGRLSCSELMGSLEWLGMKVQPDDVYELVKYMDKSGIGAITYRDFEAVFGASDGDWIINKVAQEYAVKMKIDYDRLNIRPRKIKELNPELDDRPQDSKVAKDVSVSVLVNLRVKVKQIEDWQFIWSSETTKARKDVSIWAPDMSSAWSKNRVKVCIGHYAATEIGNPSRNKPPSSLKGFLLEVSDERSGLFFRSKLLEENLINHLLPIPVRYKQVWSEISGSKPLYVWRAIPPSDHFICLGMVCTVSEDPPPADSMRCIPLSWVKPNKMAPRLIWDDSGTGGRRGSFWFGNGLKLMVAVEGHDPPTGSFFDFPKPSFLVPDLYEPEHHDKYVNPDNAKADALKKEAVKGVMLHPAGRTFDEGKSASNQPSRRNSGAASANKDTPLFPSASPSVGQNQPMSSQTLDHFFSSTAFDSNDPLGGASSNSLDLFASKPNPSSKLGVASSSAKPSSSKPESKSSDALFDSLLPAPPQPSSSSASKRNPTSLDPNELDKFFQQ